MISFHTSLMSGSSVVRSSSSLSGGKPTTKSPVLAPSLGCDGLRGFRGGLASGTSRREDVSDSGSTSLRLLGEGALSSNSSGTGDLVERFSAGRNTCQHPVFPNSHYAASGTNFVWAVLEPEWIFLSGRRLLRQASHEVKV